MDHRKFERYEGIIDRLYLLQEDSNNKGDIFYRNVGKCLSYFLKKSVEAANGNGSVLDHALLDSERFNNLSSEEIAFLKEDYRKTLDKGDCDYKLSFLGDRFGKTAVRISLQKKGFKKFKLILN